MIQNAPEKQPTEQPVPSTFERLLFDFGTRIFNLARRLLNRVEDAEDLTQDVLIKLAQKLEQFRGDSSLETWVYRVTVNAALDFRRKNVREPECCADPSPESRHLWFPGSRAAGGRDPQRRAMNAEAKQLVEQAVRELPEHYRDVYVLTDVEGLPIAEVAELLQISVAAAKSRLHRARLILRQVMAPYFEEPLT